MANQSKREQNESPRLAVRVEYVGVIAVVCLFVGALVGGSLSSRKPDAPAASPAAQASADTNTMEMLAQVQSVNDYGKLVEMGNTAFESKQPALAIHAYEKALKIKPGDANVMTDLGTMYLDIDQPTRAIELFRQAATIAPTHPNSRYNLGVALLRTNDRTGAKEAFEQAIKVDPASEVAKAARDQIAKLGK